VFCVFQKNESGRENIEILGFEENVIAVLNRNPARKTATHRCAAIAAVVAAISHRNTMACCVAVRHCTARPL